MARNKLTLLELHSNYLDWVCKNKASSTFESKKYILDSFVVFVVKPGLKAADVKPALITKWMNKGNKVSDTTIHTRIIHIKSMFNWAVKMELLEKNPIQNMPMPTPKMRRDFIPPERFEEFLGYIENEEFRDFCFVMLDSGARVQEMLVLEAQYYDKEKKRLTLPAEKSKGRKACRTIYLPPKSSNIVETYCGHFPVGSLFRDSNAVPWRKDSLGRMLKPLKEKMGMPGLCMTTLRHSFAHSRLVKGQDAVTVAKLMGHASTNMVYQRYGHLDGSDFLAEKANELAL